MSKAVFTITEDDIRTVAEDAGVKIFDMVKVNKIFERVMSEVWPEYAQLAAEHAQSE